MNGTPNIGLMLYTVREECARDLESVLRNVAELGFDGVELFDLHGHAPEQVRGWLDEIPRRGEQSVVGRASVPPPPPRHGSS